MSGCVRFLIAMLAAAPAAASGPAMKMIADMEDNTAFKAEGRETQPEVMITDLTASQGNRSLRFAHNGSGPSRAGVSFPITNGGGGFDVLAFDIYCERETRFSRINVRLSQKQEAPKKVGLFSATVRVNQFIDGFSTVRLAVGAGFEFLSIGGAKADWNRLREVSFHLHDEGDTIFYLDNIRFERMRLRGSENLLFNGSFELTATPDVPDGWGRDLAIPPFGSNVWSIDATTAWDGKKSLRINDEGKFARYWIGHLKSNKDQAYAFSVYMKAARPETRVEVRVNGVKGTREEVAVGEKWARYSVTGVADGQSMFPQVTLLSGGPLWLDAAQLETGVVPTTFQPADLDLVKRESATTASKQFSGAEFPDAKRSKHLVRQTPVIGGARPMFTLAGTEVDFYTKEATARARCFVDADAKTCRQTVLSWWVENDNGAITSQKKITPKPGINEWTIALAGLTEGAYTLNVICNAPDAPAVTAQRVFRKLPPARHEVRVNQWGRFLVCNGKPHLWFGFYDALYSKAKIDNAWPETLDDMRSANCNTVLMYTHDLVKQPASITKALDEAHARGIKVWLHLSWIFSYINPRYARYDRYRTEAEAIAALEQIIATHKNHPALLGWCHLDEPANRPTIFTSELVNRWYQRIKKLDPHHPCISSHLTHLGESEIYGQAVDYAMIPFHSPHDVRAIRLFKEFWDAGLGISTNASFYGAIHRPNESTPAQARVSIYAPIILGARGFCSYTYRPASMQTWREIGRVGAELAALAPVLCTPDQHLHVDVFAPNKGVHALLKQHAGKYFLLAVNANPQTVEAEFRLSGARSVSTVRTLFDTSAAKVNRATKSLSVIMTARNTGVWEISP